MGPGGHFTHFLSVCGPGCGRCKMLGQVMYLG